MNRRSCTAARDGLALIALGLLACSAGSDGPSSSPDAVTVVVTPSSTVLTPSARRTFAAQVSGALDTSVTWSITEGATGGMISSGGDYTAPATTGTYHVVATSNADPSKLGTATVTVSAAPSIDFAIRSAHPRILWTPSRIAQAQSWLAAHPFTPDSTDYFDVAWKHVVAGTDCSSAITWAVNNTIPCSSPTNAGCDDARWYGQDAFFVYDWCYDQWTDQQRSDFLSNVGGSGAGWNDYLAGINQQSWGDAGMIQNNYNWGNLRNDIAFGIATNSENPSAPIFLADGIANRWQTFAGSVDTCMGGGVAMEGTAYGSAMIPPSSLFVTMADGGRDLLNETGFYKQLTYYIIYSTTPGPTYHAPSGVTAYQLSPFSDDEIFLFGGVLNQRPYYQDWMNFASNYWSTLDVGRHARQWVNTVAADAGTKATSRSTLAQDASPAAASYANLPLDYFATGIQYLYGRKAWDTSSSHFLWQLGSAPECAGGGNLHGHGDIGNLNLWRGGRWLTRESTGYFDKIAGYAGSTTDGDCGNSPAAGMCADGIMAHNGIVFAAPLAPSGTWRPRLATRPRGPTSVRRLESRAGYTYADADLTGQYQWEAGYSQLETGAAVHVERELLFVRALETTVVLDRVTTGAPVTGDDAGKTAAQVVTTFLLHSETAPGLEDGTHFTMTNGSQALRVTTLVPPAPARRIVNEQSCTDCSPGVGQYRVEIDASGSAQRYFLHVLQARDAGAANVGASVVDSSPADPSAGTFTVTLQPAAGAPTVVVFQKGQTSSGGTLDLAGAGAKSLATGVQGITYTDSGPVWATP